MQRAPLFSQKQDLANPRLWVQAQAVINRLPLLAVVVVAPFLPETCEAVQRPQQVYADSSRGTPAPLLPAAISSPFTPSLFEGVQYPRGLPADTSHGTPKGLFADTTFAPAQSEFQTISRPAVRPTDTSFRNTAILDQPVAPPFVPVDFSNIPWTKWLSADTSKGSSEALLNPNPFWGYPQVSAPMLPRGILDTSQGSPLSLITTPVQAPFWNDTYNVVRPPFNVVDTSKGTPLPLLTAQVFAPFYQTDFPSPIEYRFKSWWTNDPQIYPEFIPPPAPPVQRVEIDGGVPKKRKSAKEEREEFLDVVVKEVLTPAAPAPELPAPLKPVQTVKQVIESPPKAVQLTMIDAIELPDEDDKIIAALIAAGLF